MGVVLLTFDLIKFHLTGFKPSLHLIEIVLNFDCILQIPCTLPLQILQASSSFMMQVINENTNGTKTDLYGMPHSVNSQFGDE